MEVDINEFKERLNTEIAKGNRNIAGFIHQEIRLSEDMKASLMEEMSENTEDFLTATAAKLDTYVFQLQEIEKEMGLTNLPLDQKTALRDTQVRKKMAEEIDKLDQMQEDDPDENVYPEKL